MAKNPSKITLGRRNFCNTRDVARGCGPYKNCSNDDSRLAFTYFMARSNMIPDALTWEGLYFLHLKPNNLLKQTKYGYIM